ncbi:hypothetical protein Nepgr_031594 [Nepenthes gracilis]|uniref:Uncharacterized protein n=1 Tax=Nepenthes gracilis TaxID=150966 RepID=A0AAD3TIT0_NEPGR|nr:hypothetical protein Nepgr_031594 [Nepenthes gracilis]
MVTIFTRSITCSLSSPSEAKSYAVEVHQYFRVSVKAIRLSTNFNDRPFVVSGSEVPAMPNSAERPAKKGVGSGATAENRNKRKKSKNETSESEGGEEDSEDESEEDEAK